MSCIRVIDFETTGFEPPAQVIEVGYADYYTAEHSVADPVSWLCKADAIPPENRAVHHITLKDTEGQPAYDRDELVRLTADTCQGWAAHNLSFEAQWLGDVGIPAICTYKAALRVWPDAPSHSNGALWYWLEDQGLISLDRNLAMPPHRAGPDAYVTAHILKALFEAGATGKEMVAWTKEPRLLPRCTIGKFKGVPWPEVEAGFLGWMLKQETMEDDLKWNARREIQRRSGVKDDAV